MEEKDPFYRYAIDAPILRYSGKNQSTMTIVENLREIASQLSRPQELLLTFLADTFHTRTGRENEIRGRYSRREIEDAVSKMRRMLVCCRQCGNPETGMRPRAGRGQLELRCSACGAKSTVEEAEIPARVWRHMCREAKRARGDAEADAVGSIGNGRATYG